jgi:hypothetical protein
MSILNKTGNPQRGVPYTVELDKSALLANSVVEADSYFSNWDHWSKVSVSYKSIADLASYDIENFSLGNLSGFQGQTFSVSSDSLMSSFKVNLAANGEDINLDLVARVYDSLDNLIATSSIFNTSVLPAWEFNSENFRAVFFEFPSDVLLTSGSYKVLIKKQDGGDPDDMVVKVGGLLVTGSDTYTDGDVVRLGVEDPDYDLLFAVYGHTVVNRINQSVNMVFNATQATPSYSLNLSDVAVDYFIVDELRIYDFDNGHIVIPRSALTTAEFDLTVDADI